MLHVARRTVALVAAALLLAGPLTSAADAKVGGGSSSGSRGVKSFTAPKSTPTAPGTVSPLQRSQPQVAPQTQPGRMAPATAPQSRSWMGSMFSGLLIGGLFGMLLGNGFGGLAGMMGFLFQIALVGGLIWLLMVLLRSRQSSSPQTAAQTASGPGFQPGAQMNRSGFGFGGGSGGSLPPLTIGEADYSSFERILTESQDAYGRGDVGALRGLATPEMAGYFTEDLSANAQKGVRNEVGGAKLLQGDLSEAWREQNGEYATVAMRYALTDATIDVKTGEVVAGSRTEPQESTEVWTFVRPAGGRPNEWRISAIQQVA